jgi:cyclophilin family peptidyl-prolyl cis-trans isomerase
MILINGCFPTPVPDTNTYTLVATTQGNGTIVSSEDETFNEGTYPAGESVLLVANPDEGWKFVRWEGDEANLNSRLLVSMNADKTVTAVFEAVQYELTTAVDGQGTVSPDSGTFGYNEQITLTATPATGWRFEGWTGGFVSSDNPAIVTMTEDKSITAVFVDEQPEYDLTITTTGQGTVSPGSGSFEAGTFLELTAAPATGWHFVRWGGDAVGSETTTQITMSQDKNITALFEQDTLQYGLTVSVNGNGAVNPNSGTYNAGQQVTLTATGDAGWHFTRWTGDLTGTDATAILTMNASKSVTAVFEIDQGTYGFAVMTEGEGTVSVSPIGFRNAGEVVPVTATPAEGWYFDRWTGDLSSSIDASSATISVTINANTEIIAVFKPNLRVLLETSKGNITIALDQAKAPITVANFLSYVNSGFFDGQDGNGETIFHRVKPGFMIQGGGFTADLTKKTTLDPIVNESNNGLTNDKYTIAMARTSDPNSATSQFFINVVDNDFLNYQDAANPGYAVFGKVIDGTDVVDAIAVVATQTVGSYQDVPVETITITGVSVVTP